MNYKERIAALKTFKSAVSGGETTDNVSGVSDEVSGWEGGSYTKFTDYITTVKSDAKTLAGKKASFLSDIDGQIAKVQALFDAEVAANEYILSTTYDSKDAAKNRQLQRSAIDSLSIDSSVKAELKSRIK